MRALLCTTLLICAAAFGQNGPSGLQCTANAGVPPVLRSEGLTELVGDIALNCAGGTPTAAGAPVPQAIITVFLNTAITSRVLPSGASEALLLIDEPPTGLTGSPAWTPFGCGLPGSCTIIGNGTGVGLYNGTPGHWNIFQGVLSGPNSVTFTVPMDAAGANGRNFHITNIRANANALSPNGAAAQVNATFSGVPSLIAAPTVPLNVGRIQSGLTVGAKGSTNQFCSGLGLNGNSDAPSDGKTVLRFTENFATAFKTKAQESGTILPTTAGLSSIIGTSDTGTNLGATIIGLQPGLTLTTPLVSNLVDGTALIGGNAMATSPTGIVSGNNLVLNGSSNQIIVNWEVMARDPSNPNPFSMSPTMVLGGTPLSLQTPATVFVILRFVDLPTVVQPYALAFSTANLLYPFVTTVNGFDTGLAPANTSIDPFVMGAEIVGCVDAGNSLNLIPGLSVPKFFNALGLPGSLPNSNAMVPPVITVPIVSSGLPTSNVTATVNPPAPWLNLTLSDTTTPLTATLTANNTIAGNYSTTITFNSPGGISTTLPVSLTAAPAPWFTIYGFGHSASYVNTVVAPGEPFVIFGGDPFGPSSIAGPILGSDGLVPTNVGNTQVLFDGTPAPIYYSVDNNGTGQVAGFAPFELTGKTTTNVQVVYNNVASPTVQLAVVDALPGLFTADSSGGGQGSILNHDLSVNSGSNPESVGNLVVLYGGAAGQTSPPGRDGALAGVGGPLATFTMPVQVFIDGIQATSVPYAGPAPGLVEGIFQVNVVIPPGVRHNANVPVVVVVNGKQSQPGVTLATK